MINKGKWEWPQTKSVISLISLHRILYYIGMYIMGRRQHIATLRNFNPIIPRKKLCSEAWNRIKNMLIKYAFNIVDQ